MKTLASVNRLFAVAFALALAGGLLLALGAGAQSPTGAPGAPSPNAVPPAIAALRLNEFMASNNNFLEDPDEPGEFPDWIEIYNPGVDAVDIKGVAFSDDLANPVRSPITGTLMVPAKGFLVFYADDDPKQGLRHLKFKLGGGGETLGLYWAATSEQIDFYEFGPQDTNVSEGRKPDGSGAWQKFVVPSPNQSNQLEPPVISNVQRSIVQPQAGQAVEVSAVVTDTKPGMTISLVYSINGSPQTPLTMPTLGNDLYSASLPGQANGVHVAYRVRALDSDANAIESRSDGYTVGYVKPNIVINEFVAENRFVEGSLGNVEDEDDPGEYPDWLELYNPGDTAVSLNGLSLTDNNLDSMKYPIPNGLSIPSKGFILFWLDNDPEQGPKHTNFALNSDGDSIALWGAEGTVLIDGKEFGKQHDNVAEGRFPDGGAMRVIVCTTPRKANMLCDKKVFLPAGIRK